MKPITVYETTDGQRFDTEADAHHHERYGALADALTEACRNGGPPSSPAMLARWLMDRVELIGPHLLSARYQSEPALPNTPEAHRPGTREVCERCVHTPAHLEKHGCESVDCTFMDGKYRKEPRPALLREQATL